jgi:hypothetical protein
VFIHKVFIQSEELSGGNEEEGAIAVGEGVETVSEGRDEAAEVLRDQATEALSEEAREENTAESQSIIIQVS